MFSGGITAFWVRLYRITAPLFPIRHQSDEKHRFCTCKFSFCWQNPVLPNQSIWLQGYRWRMCLGGDMGAELKAHHLFWAPIGVACNPGSVPCKMAAFGRWHNLCDPQIPLIHNGNRNSSCVVNTMRYDSNACNRSACNYDWPGIW